MHSSFRLIVRFVCAASVLCVALPGAAAPAPQRIAVAATTPSAAPTIIGVAWIDQADGSSMIDLDQGQAIEDIFAFTTWEFYDNDQIVVSHTQNGTLVPFLRFDSVSLPGYPYFFHERTPDGTGIDGFIARDPKDPSQGYAYFNVQMTDAQGRSSSTFVFADLAFAPGASP